MRRLLACFCLPLILSSCANWRPFASAAPPYGIASFENETTIQGENRHCITKANGGIETQGPQVQGKDACGSELKAGAISITAFEGQGNGAAIYAAKVQADLQRDIALINAGQQLGATGICGVLLGTGAGAAVPAAAAQACAKALGIAPPSVSVVPRKQSWVRGKTGTLRMPVSSVNGVLTYLTPGGHLYNISDKSWWDWAENADL